VSRAPGVPVRRGPEARPRPLVLTGGGTGGHLYPAVSIAHAALGVGRGALGDVEPDPNVQRPTPSALSLFPVFIGTRTGLEAEVVPREGFEFHAIASRKVKRSLSPAAVLSLASIAWGTVQAGLLLRRLDPVAVIGTGGYASAGVVLAAALQGIPTLIHEQNSVPGRTNRLLSRIVRRVAITFSESASYFPAGKCAVTGLPIRPEIAHGQRERGLAEFGLRSDRTTLLVIGGSLGARSLNRAVLQALPHWSNSGLQVLHQVGKGNWDEHRAALTDAPDSYHPVPYLTEMGDAYAAADLVLCRAGASTLAEVALAGLPAVLVPYPHAHADHQTANARSVVADGAAVLLPDGELSGERLVTEINALLGDPQRLHAMAEASQRRARPDAAEAILAAVSEMIGAAPLAGVEHSERGAKRGAA
jgi:UDP-N-acetylglucosamine--N-acetylmuramyl-(pentapeptide) pyrophosphoryl-undecaprenol N-acetylglucosamine transferase